MLEAQCSLKTALGSNMYKAEAQSLSAMAKHLLLTTHCPLRFVSRRLPSYFHGYLYIIYNPSNECLMKWLSSIFIVQSSQPLGICTVISHLYVKKDMAML